MEPRLEPKTARERKGRRARQRHTLQRVIYTVNQKKRGSLFLTITLAILNRFL